jgi:hypothetical protein
MKWPNKNKKIKNKKDGGDSPLLKYAKPIGQHLPTSKVNFRDGTKARKLA